MIAEKNILTDERVVAQLRAKHRVRETPMPGVLDDGGVPFERLHLSLGERYRKLKRMKGTGPSGYRNEYLMALVGHFADTKADNETRILFLGDSCMQHHLQQQVTELLLQVPVIAMTDGVGHFMSFLKHIGN